MKHATIAVLAVLGAIMVSGAAPALTTTGWTEYSSNPVYAPGKAYYPTIIKDAGVYTMWSDCAAGVQMATSADGITWATAGTVTGLTTPAHTLVEKIGSNYQMWYFKGLGYGISDIRTATSTDGLHWTNDQPITQVGNSVVYNDNSNSTWNRGSYGPGDVIYNPSGSDTIVDPVDKASVWANKYVMYYDGTGGSFEALGLAVSNDGVNWQGYNGGVSPVFAGSGVAGSWDSIYATRATVVRVSDSSFAMWYSGGQTSMDAGIGFATSTDGINWVRDADNPIFAATDGIAWRNVRTYTPMVIDDQMWFTGKDLAGNYTIGYATPEPASMGLLILGGLLGLARRKH
jgi:hypothetical protein